MIESLQDDRQIERFRRELSAFVPPNSFDAHAHLYRSCDANASLPRHVEYVDAAENAVVGWRSWRVALQSWLGERVPVDGLFFAFPKAGIDVDAANTFVLDQISNHSESRALLLVKPDDDPAQVEALVASSGAVGFKVYHVYASRPDTMNAEIGEFLPEWAWELAHQRGLIIMLHMVRDRALADPANQQYLRTHCLEYPDANLVLAHAARGFCAAHTVEGIASLRGLENVYFDTSVVCETPALSAILREFGPSRLLFGTDFSVSELLGRCVSIGDSFLWLTEKNVSQDSNAAPFTLVGIESLLAVREACHEARLRDADVEQIFRENAQRLLGLDQQPRGSATQALYQRAKQLIPGGSQLLSKRPEMYAPRRWPAYYSEARGCQIIDLDGREYTDMTTSGIGSCLLGYADPEVCEAVTRRVQRGSMSTLNAPEEVELAELLVSIHPWANQVRFCRTGGETMAAAVRIARARTGRDVIAFCGYHGWADWYLSANLVKPSSAPAAAADRLAGHLLSGLSPVGVPTGLAGTTLPFAYNRIEELRQIVAEHGDKLAAVVMEPFRTTEPEPNFLAEVREICDHVGAVLIFDEITSGWRFGFGGLHLALGVEPDIAVFAKALGNGFPMSAILGRSHVMDAVQQTFVSSTYWTEAIGPTAALATLRKMERVGVAAHVARIGAELRAGLQMLATEHAVPLRIAGRDALLNIAFAAPQAAALGTLFTVRMLDRGILAGSGFYPSYAHQPRHVGEYLAAANEVLPEIRAAIQQEDAALRLEGEVRHSGFTRLT